VSESGQSGGPPGAIPSLVDTFAGVVTTGIYCRPGCGGRPHAANVRRYGLAAAAEAAGFRACFQCRPYRWPQSVSWTRPELVCRAVRLILDGALDGSTEEQLGARLGVSARHLRRLFTEHLGVTPDGLARSARAHFARRLLDDTDLSMIEIALATGFGSLRQFNRACREIFRASPRELRSRRRKADRLVADGGLPLRLAFRGALDWDAIAGYLGDRAVPGVESVSGQTYRRTVSIGGDAGVVELAPGGVDHLVLVAHLPHWEELVHVVSRARRIASLDLDLDEPAGGLANAQALAPLIRARPGLRPPGTWDPFEAGVCAIIGERTPLAAARSITQRLVERCGKPVQGLRPMGLTHVFPTASALARADLSGLGLTHGREEAIRSFATAYLEGTVRLDGSVGLDALVASLVAAASVEPSTAHAVAYRLGEPDAFPVDEIDPTGASRELAGQAEAWRPWRAIAVAHLSLAGPSELARVA
jgi:AraC family transcriptional regulator, regulatory protein of adaptative response / DNA-3-methyladenine glycosylase II